MLCAGPEPTLRKPWNSEILLNYTSTLKLNTLENNGSFGDFGRIEFRNSAFWLQMKAIWEPDDRVLGKILIAL